MSARATDWRTAVEAAESFAELAACASELGLTREFQQRLTNAFALGWIPDSLTRVLRAVTPESPALTLRELLESSALQRKIELITRPAQQAELLNELKRLLLEPAPPASALKVEALNQATLRAWAKERKIGEVIALPLEVLKLRVPEGVLNHVGKRLYGQSTLGDLWNVQLDTREFQVVREAAWELLTEEAARAEQAAGEEGPFLASLGEPPPELTELRDRLLELRRNLRQYAAPTPESQLAEGKVHLVASPLELRFDDPRPMRTWNKRNGEVQAKVALERWDERVLELRCDCELRGPPRCRHALAAVDAALLLIARGPREDQKTLATQLTKPRWAKVLDLIGETARKHAEDAPPAGARIAWLFDLKERLKPMLQVPKRAGGYSAGTRVPLEELAAGRVACASADDVRAATALVETDRAEGRGTTLAALTALCGAPNVFLAGAKDRPLRIAETELQLQCSDNERGGYDVHLAVEGAWVEPPSSFEWDPGTRWIHLDPERFTCFLVRINPALLEIHRLTQHLHEGFPSSAAEALADKLSELRVPVVLPPALSGEKRDAVASPVVFLSRIGNALELELYVRPIPGGLTFPVGNGPVLVRGKVSDRRVHVEREYEKERQAAHGLFQRLGLSTPAASAPWSARLEGPPALDVFRVLEALVATEGQEVVWPPNPPRLTTPLRAKDLRVTVREGRDWFGVGGGAQLDGYEVKLAALLEAARRRQRWVAIGEDAWAELSEELARELEPVADQTDEGKEGLELSLAGALALERLAPQLGEIDRAPSFVELGERIRAAQALTFAVPSGLTAELRPYQVEGFLFLARLAGWSQGAVLADDMGLGKTLQTLALLLQRAERGPALVVAPTSVCFNWELEAARFAPGLKLISYRGSDREQVLEEVGPGDVLVTSYGLLLRDAKRFATRRYATLVLDEAQALKNASAQRSQAVAKIGADFRVALTGTPLENHLGELWSLFRAVYPGLLGSEERFRANFRVPIERDRDPARRRALSARVAPFLLRRKKVEVERDLPPKTEVNVPVALSDEERTLYEQTRRAAIAELHSKEAGPPEQRRFQVLAALTRLRQLACHPRLHDVSWDGPASKLERLCELALELKDEGHRALVFSQFTRHLALVRAALEARGLTCQYLDGETPEAERRKRVEAFQSGIGDLFLISLKAGGTGLNLTGADHVIHLDPWWNPAVEDQATDRAHRIGQTKPVTVFRLYAKGTVEEAILAMHGEKRSLVTSVLDGTGVAAALDADALMELLEATQRDPMEELATKPIRKIRRPRLPN